MLTNYERRYTESLKRCNIEQELKFFGEEKDTFFRHKNYLAYTEAFIYWSRLNLHVSNYEIIESTIKEIITADWYNSLPVFLQSRLGLIRAKLYYSLGDYTKADLNTDEILSEIEVKSPNGLGEDDCDFFFCRAYLLKAKIHWRNRDIYRAKLYLALSYANYREANPYSDHYLFARLISHYGQIYLHEGKIEKAKKFFNQSEDYYKNKLEKQDHHFYISEINGQFSACFLRQGDYLGAREKISKAKKFLNQEFPASMKRQRSHLLHLEALSYLLQAEKSVTNVEFKEELLENAHQALFEELELRAQLFPNGYHLTLARLWNNLSKVYCLKGEFTNALEAIRKALGVNIVDWGKSQISIENMIKQSNSSYEILISIQRKSEIYWSRYKKNKSARDLLHTWDQIEKAQKTINIIREKYYIRESKMDLGATARQIYEFGLAVLLERKKMIVNAGSNSKKILLLHQDVFDLFCNSKSYVLVRSLHPNPLRDLNKDSTNNNFPVTPSQWRQLLQDIDQCFESNFEYSNFDIGIIEKLLLIMQDPPLEDSNSSKEMIALKDIYKELSNTKDTGTILSYFIGEHSLYALVIRGDLPYLDLQFECLINDKKDLDQLKTNISNLAKTFNNIFPDEEVRDEIYDEDDKIDFLNRSNWVLYALSKELYAQLIAKLKLRSSGRLYIIPDESLFNVPFSFLSKSFLDKDAGAYFSNLDYLALNYKISYHISIALLHRNHSQTSLSIFTNLEESTRTTLSIYSIAGCSVKNGKFPNEQNAPNRHGISDVADAFEISEDRQIVLKEPNEKDKWDIKYNAEQQHIFHFFGHSYFGNEYIESPALLLRQDLNSDNKILLTQEEIGQFKLDQNRLILINACLGGTGKTINGEGPLSINQAFLLAKAKNIYYSLFQIQQKSAREFTCYFVEQLVKGKNFVTALQDTQQHFILSRENETSHPTAWAAAAFIGDQMESLFEEEE